MQGSLEIKYCPSPLISPFFNRARSALPFDFLILYADMFCLGSCQHFYNYVYTLVENAGGMWSLKDLYLSGKSKGYVGQALLPSA